MPVWTTLICIWLNNSRSPTAWLQHLHLHGVVVADAEVTHLAGFLEVAERTGDFLRLRQGIRAVDEQRVQMIGVQLAQAVSALATMCS